MVTSLGEPDVNKLVRITESAADVGKVDDTKNMANDRIYVLSGDGDTVVESSVVESLLQYYKHFVNSVNIVGDFSVEAQHCQPTLNYGEDCQKLSSPYIGKCGFDGAGAALATLSPTPLTPRGVAVPANLQSFSQTGYFSDQHASIGDLGYLYVPTACADQTTPCSLHISFHGCHQGLDEIGKQYAENVGYNEWAETNNIVVLYPYAKVSSSRPTNPNGCWDWWGYTNFNYAVKVGVQMDFVRKMMKDLTGV